MRVFKVTPYIGKGIRVDTPYIFFIIFKIRYTFRDFNGLQYHLNFLRNIRKVEISNVDELIKMLTFTYDNNKT